MKRGKEGRGEGEGCGGKEREREKWVGNGNKKVSFGYTDVIHKHYMSTCLLYSALNRWCFSWYRAGVSLRGRAA